jgi:hypothetical protein
MLLMYEKILTAPSLGRAPARTTSKVVFTIRIGPKLHHRLKEIVRPGQFPPTPRSVFYFKEISGEGKTPSGNALIHLLHAEAGDLF